MFCACTLMKSDTASCNETTIDLSKQQMLNGNQCHIHDVLNTDRSNFKYTLKTRSWAPFTLYRNVPFWPTVYTVPFSYPASNENCCITKY